MVGLNCPGLICHVQSLLALCLSSVCLPLARSVCSLALAYFSSCISNALCQCCRSRQRKNSSLGSSGSSATPEIFLVVCSNMSCGGCRSAFSVSCWWWWFWCGSSARGSHSSSLCLQGEAPFPLLQQLRAPGGAARRRGPAHGGPEQNQLKEFCHGETQQLINWAPRPRVFPEGFSHSTSGAERRLRRRQGQVKGCVLCLLSHSSFCEPKISITGTKYISVRSSHKKTG